MKISLSVTVIIVALFAFFCHQGRQRLDKAKLKHDQVLTEAGARGVGMVTTADSPAILPQSSAARAEEQKARERRAKEAARKLAVFGNDRDAIGAMGPHGDQDKQLDFQEGMAEATELDPAGLSILIDQLIDNSELDDEMRGNFVMMVGYQLTEKEPLRALDLYMDAMSRLTISADVARSLVGFTLERLAGSNPQQALDWVERNKTDHPGLIDDLTKVGILSGIAKSDAPLAFSSLGEFGMSNNAQALERIGSGASSAEERSAVLAAMRDYASRAGSEEERQIAVRSTLAGMAAHFSQGGFDSASAWLETAKLTPEEAAGLSGGINAFLAKGDTGRWIDWMSGIVPADQLGAKVDELVKFWTQEDYRSARAWLGNVPEGATRNAAVKAYAGMVASADPGGAAQWALSLPAGDERTDLMKTIYGEWKKQDEAAAGKFARDNRIGE